MRILIEYGIADFDIGNEIRRLLDGTSFARRTLQECTTGCLRGTVRSDPPLMGEYQFACTSDTELRTNQYYSSTTVLSTTRYCSSTTVLSSTGTILVLQN